MPQSGFAISVPEAVGVVGVLLPDNNPLYSLVTLLGAAVATGNAVVIVPSLKYPLPALMFIQVYIISLIIDISNTTLKWKGQVYCWRYIHFFNLELTSSILGLHPASLFVFSKLLLRAKSSDLKIDIVIRKHFSLFRFYRHVTCQQV